MATLESLLAGRNLCKQIEGVKTGLPLVVPPGFLTVTDPIRGHTAEWLEVDGQRSLAKICSQNSPANRVGLREVRAKSATLLRTFESQQHMLNDLRNKLRMDGVDTNVRDEMGAQFVTDNSMWFRKRQQNLIQTCVQVMLADFALYFDGTGNLLPSSSGAVVSIDPAIPAGQTGQLNILGGGAIIGTTWDTATVDIPGNINEIKAQMLQLGGWQITHAFYGKNIPKYIAKNDFAKELIHNNQALNAQRFGGRNIVPNGFQELNWIPMHDLYYLDATDTVVKPLGDDEIVFTPDPDSSWWRMFSGTEMVPNGTAVAGQSIDQCLGGHTEVQGPFMYAASNHNPASVELFAGDNFLPLICATKAVCRADVVP